jgi:hypothetical protein
MAKGNDRSHIDNNDGAIIMWLSFSEESLAKIDDIELVTLKIHIVLESALHFLLCKRLLINGERIPINNGQIMFNVLFQIALTGINNPHLLQAVRALNEARNSISHHINSPKLFKHLGDFVCEIASMQGEKCHWPSDLSEQLKCLRKAFYDAGYAIFDYAINKTPKKSA